MKRTVTSRWIGILAATILGGAIVAVPVASAGAAQPKEMTRGRLGTAAEAARAAGISQATLDRMAAQAGIDNLADRIEATAHDTATSGLAGFRVDSEQHTLQVYWHGQLPEAASYQITAARAKGMTVDVSPAPYTRSQLVAEVARLAKLNMSPAGAAAVRLASLWPKFDGSGIGAGVSGFSGSLTAADVAARTRQLLPALSSAMPLEIEATPEAQPSDRFEDSSPFWGGALETTGAFWCTTAFGVSGNAGGSFMLTANHCTHGTWFTGGQDVRIGSTVASNMAIDAQLLASTAGSNIYIGASAAGGVQGPSPVRGSQSNRVGDFVCTSGAFSGTVCDIKVANTGISISMAGYGTVTGVVAGAEVHGNAAVGNGDSGGPVVVLNGGDLSSVARGTISAMSTVFVPCPGMPTGPGRNCSNIVYFPDIAFALHAFNIHVNVS